VGQPRCDCRRIAELELHVLGRDRVADRDPLVDVRHHNYAAVREGRACHVRGREIAELALERSVDPLSEAGIRCHE
jgi:hypothetical protein